MSILNQMLIDPASQSDTGPFYAAPNPGNSLAGAIQRRATDVMMRVRGREQTAGIGYVDESVGTYETPRGDLFAGVVDGPVGRTGPDFDGSYYGTILAVPERIVGPVGRVYSQAGHRATSALRTAVPTDAAVVRAFTTLPTPTNEGATDAPIQ